jgi:hypothetical protein
MSTQESTWLAWYMCAVSLMMTALGLLFLIASQSLASAPVFDYWQPEHASLWLRPAGGNGTKAR